MASKYADDGDVWWSADGSDGVWGGINGLCVGGILLCCGERVIILCCG